MTYPYAIPANLDQWAADVEAIGRYPASDTAALVAWGTAEGGSFHNPDYGNVLGTTLGEPGSAPTNSAGVQNYAASGQSQAQAWQEGLDATISMFHQSNMAQINSALSSGNASAELPAALNADPWGTSGSTVAQILGENPDTINALGSASSGASSGGNGVQVAGNATETGIASALGGTALQFFGLQQGEHIMVRGAFAIVGLVLLIIALKEMFSNNSAVGTVTSIPSQGYQTVKSGVKKGADVGAAAGAAAAA